MRCGSCRFAELTVLGETPVMECRRYPPQLFVIDVEEEHASDGSRMSEAVQGFPNVQAEDWCGEYAPIKDGA